MKFPRILSVMILLAAALVFCTELNAQKRKPVRARKKIASPVSKPASSISAGKLSPEMQRRVETFNFAWQIIKNNYFDQTFSGLDWDKIQLEYAPKVLKTATDSQLHDILQEMINRLDRSHFAVIPPEVFQAIETAKSKAKEKEEARRQTDEAEETDDEAADDEKFDLTEFTAKYGIGIELRLMENQFVVTRVEENSAAQRAGIKPGYIVEKINDVSLTEFLKRIEIFYAKIRNIKKHLPAEIVEYLIDGEKDSLVSLTVSGETGQTREIQIPRERLKGELISMGGNYPEQFLKFEAVSLSDQTGYIKFNAFALPVIEKFCEALTELKDKQAIVIDLRGNTGGILDTLNALGGMLTETSIDLGTSIYKIGSEKMNAPSKAKNYKGKLVFLVDGQTASAAEIFAAGLQENNRALVVGEKTAGEALPSVSVELPTGAVLLYPIANFKTRKGNFLEGKGVEPNFPVALDRKSLLEGKDRQLETALGIIKQNTEFAKLTEAAKSEKLTEEAKGSAQAPSAPPPPAPKGKQLAVVTIKAPPLPASPPRAYKKDAKALQVITEFVKEIGGEEALNRINSYILNGTTEINYRGAKVESEINILRQKPDRYAEIIKSSANGEVKQVYNGKKYFVQNEYGVEREITGSVKIDDIEIYAPLYTLLKKDSFKSLTYMGAFDMLGEQAHVVEAVNEKDQTIAFAFNVKTKMLVSFTQQYFVTLFGDYRPVEKVLLPFVINRGSFMNVRLDEIKINAPIPESSFAEKENCYDKAN